MSLDIVTKQIKEVLLAGDGWIQVMPDTFEIDAYEFVDEFIESGPVFGEGTGFRFRGLAPWSDGQIHKSVVTESMYAGPITSILAVRYTLET